MAQPKTGRERNIELDGLRGIAALNVAIFHTILGIDYSLTDRIVYKGFSDLHSGYEWAAKLALKLFSGETAVFIFFVLSGTVLFSSLVRERTPIAALILGFPIRRVLRIYPALIVCLLFDVGLSVLAGQQPNFYGLIINASLYDFPINGVTWTLNVEMVAMVFIILSYLGWKSAGVVGLGMTAAAIGLFFRYSTLPVAETLKHFWLYFILGMFIPTNIGSMVAQFLPRWSTTLVLLMTIFFKSTIQQIAICLLVTMIFYGKVGSFGDILRSRFAQFFGRISYSFYLFNFSVFVYICGYAKQFAILAENPIVGGLLLSIATVGTTIPFAYLSMKFVELPAIELARRLINRRKQTDMRHA